jgi:hypothetical protein
MVHDFFENALTGFLKDIYGKLKPYEGVINAKFPVMIMNTGDETFLSNMLDEDSPLSVSEPKLYQRVPRMVCNPLGIDISTDQLSAKKTYGKMVDISNLGYKTKKATNVRRIPLTTVISSKVYFSNIFQYLQFVEILLMTAFKENTYNFVYVGNTQVGSYSFTTSFEGVPNLSLSHDSEKRWREMELSFTLGLQYPAYDYYGGATELMDATNTIKIFKNFVDTTTDPKILTTTKQNLEVEMAFNSPPI